MLPGRGRTMPTRLARTACSTVDAAGGVLANDSDIDGDALTVTLVDGPPNGTVTLGADGSFEYTPAADFNGADSFTYTACDPAPLCDTATVTITVTPVNDPPIADAGPDQSVTVGDLVTLDGSGSSDPDGDPLSHAWQITSAPVGSSATLADATTVGPTFTPDEPGDYTLTITVDDGQLTDADTVVISADPVQGDLEGPITSLVVLDPNPAPIDMDVALAGLVDDTLTGGSLIARAEYSVDGDPFSPLGATDGAFDSIAERVAGTIPAARFSTAAVHSVCVRGIDAAGNLGDADCVLVAVYDPEGGFVTGGGWIDSPEGASLAYPELTGRANFGFVAKYKKGRSVPDGQTEFVFSAGDLNFHSTAYEYLLVNKGGSRAQFKGSGTINGEGDYRFKIWATDDGDDGDTFRIRIWDEAGGVETVIYDNMSDQASLRRADHDPQGPLSQGVQIGAVPVVRKRGHCRRRPGRCDGPGGMRSGALGRAPVQEARRISPGRSCGRRTRWRSCASVGRVRFR